jgi:hypothetical protein
MSEFVADDPVEGRRARMRAKAKFAERPADLSAAAILPPGATGS